MGSRMVDSPTNCLRTPKEESMVFLIKGNIGVTFVF